jgi:hypothetical protein
MNWMSCTGSFAFEAVISRITPPVTLTIVSTGLVKVPFAPLVNLICPVPLDLRRKFPVGVAENKSQIRVFLLSAGDLSRCHKVFAKDNHLDGKELKSECPKHLYYQHYWKSTHVIA